MYKNIDLITVQGEARSVPFQASATTAIRYRQVFHRELMGDITSLLTSVDPGQLKTLAAAQAKGQVDIENMDPEVLKMLIQLVGSGDMEVIQQLAYIMHVQAAKADASAFALDAYVDWLDQFESMEFFTHAVDFISLYMGQRESTSTQKKDSAQLTET